MTSVYYYQLVISALSNIRLGEEVGNSRLLVWVLVPFIEGCMRRPLFP